MTPPAQRRPPLRILTAVPLCDGHDSAVMTINAEFTRAGMEVVYLGYHRGVQAIARAAIQEDVRAVGISSYNGGHVEFFAAVRQALDARGGAEIGLFGGGGGTITREDAALMMKQGTDRIFFAGEPLSQIVQWTEERYRPSEWPLPERRGDAGTRGHGDGDCELAREITWAETRSGTEGGDKGEGDDKDEPGKGSESVTHQRIAPGHPLHPLHPLHRLQSPRHSRAIGVTGPGGAGKSTLIDELVRRCLGCWPEERVAVLSNDPSTEGPSGEGALLGDRATMIYCQDDRVFMRSLATRGALAGISAAVPDAVRLLRARGFRRIFVESVGIGQETVPFPPGMVDTTLMVMTPEYGGRLQLRKIAMLRQADLVVVNKADRPAAPTARTELEARMAEIGRTSPVMTAVAKRHRDPGVDAVFAVLEADDRPLTTDERPQRKAQQDEQDDSG